MISKKLTLHNIASLVKNKRIFFRADFNVPLKDGHVANTKRITSTLPSIKFLLQNGAKSITLASHLGRPQGQRKPQFSLQPVTQCLKDFLETDVKFLDINGNNRASIDQVNSSSGDGKIFLLQNLRFNAAQEGKGAKDGVKFKASEDEVNSFRQYLSSFGQLYVNDAFGTSHRPHSSMVGVNSNGIRAAGFLVEKELEYFSKVLKTPQRPLVVFMGGAKVHDKLPLLKNLIKIADQIAIGGAMAFTFLKVHKNMQIGKSLFDQQGSTLVPQIMKIAKQNNVKIHLPEDIVCGNQFSSSSQVQRLTVEQGVPGGWMGLDVGEKTVKKTQEVISRAKTMFWNGPQGAFEIEQFSNGSRELLKSVIEATNKGMISVAGGGDTINMCKLVDGGQSKLSHVSTGGGASLEFMEGKVLPGIDALSDVDNENVIKH